MIRNVSFPRAASPQPADREPRGSLVTPAGVAFNLSVQTFPCLSLSHKPKQQPLSAPLIAPADRVTGLAPLWACSVIHLLILIFFFLLSLFLIWTVCVWLENETGGSRWRAIDRILPGDRGRSLPLRFFSLPLGWSGGAPRPSRPSLAAIQPHRSDSGPSHPKGDWGSETRCRFCGGDPPVQTDSRQR